LLISTLLLVFSIVLLYFGAEFSLESSEKVGKKIGLSPLMIGMLLIGLGTSLPELFVGHIAGVQGKSGIAIGSLVGSNIANMFLILGIGALLVRMNLSEKMLRSQLVLHLVLGLILAFVLTRESLTIITAAPLIGLCGFYLFMLMKDFKNSDDSTEDQNNIIISKVDLLKLFAGFGMLYLGGELLVKSGSDLGVAVGIDEYIISAIFIAFGTSFPELVTTILAAVKKKHPELIVGNIIGSNFFNCAFILGSLGVYDFKLDINYQAEILGLVLGALLLVILSFAKLALHRVVGILFLLSYGTMVAYWLGLF
jgi:cation:H+ antiporter